MIAHRVTWKGIEGTYYNSWDTPGYAASIPFKYLGHYTFRNRYYLAGYELYTKSAIILILQSISGYAKIAIWRDKFAQLCFNRRPLIRHQRIELLQAIVARTLEDDNYTTSATDLVDELHSPRAFQHPSSQKTINYYQWMLSALVESGDIIEQGGHYSLSPGGINGLAAFELEERRYRENLRQQKQITYLTVALVLVAAVQAFITWIGRGS